MARTTPALVQEIVEVHGADQAAKDTNITPFITIANAVLTNAAAACTGLGNAGTATLELIERNLAAHYYAASPQGRTARVIKTDAVGDGVSRTWSVPAPVAGHGFVSTTYGQAAMDLDPTGCLARMGRRRAVVAWLGTPSSTNTHTAGAP